MDDHVRASDADRNAVVERLERAFNQGRLTVTEFDERVAAAYASKTQGELSLLTGDLPQSIW